MSSVIVLDSSDDDESKLKRATVVQTNAKIIKSVDSPILDGFTTTISIHPKSRFLPINASITSHNGSIFTKFGEPSKHNNELETNKEGTQPSTNQSTEINLSRISETKCEKSTFSKSHKQSQLRILRTPTPIPGIMPTSPKHSSHLLQFVSPSTVGQSCSSTENETITVKRCSPLLCNMSSIHPIIEAGRQPPLKLLATPPHNPVAKISNGEDESENHHSTHQAMNDNQCDNWNTATNFSEQRFINVNNAKTDVPQTLKRLPAVSVSKTLTAMSANTTFFSNASISKPIRRVKPISIEKRYVDFENDQLNITSKFLTTFCSPISLEMPKSNQTHVINDRVKLQSITLAKNPLNKAICNTHNNQMMPGHISDIESSCANDFTKHELAIGPSLNSEKKNKSCSKYISFNSKKQKLTEAFKMNKFKTYSNVECQLEANYRELIQVCRQIDSSADMEKLIKRKLIKYYFEVHPDFVKSKSFLKNIRHVIESIRSEPDLIYYNLKTIVEELKIRRKSQTTVANDIQSNATSPSEHNENGVVENHNDDNSHTNRKTEGQIRKLNKALYILTKRIDVLERTEVDLDNEDSSYLRMERFKKRACQIYEKICDLTGESKTAHRLVKKPIKFNDTAIPQFNKTLQTFINRTREFPDYFDVLRMLEHCNRTYSLGLLHNQIKNIAEEAFIKVGKLLQSRRRTELYETLNYFGGSYIDPAVDDPLLAAKLSENQQKQKKINDILEKFVLKQEMPKTENLSNSIQNVETTSNIPIRGELSYPTMFVADTDEHKPSTSVLGKSPLTSSTCEIPLKIKPTTKPLSSHFGTYNKQLKELMNKVNLEASDNIELIQTSENSINGKDIITSKQKKLESNKIILKSHLKIAKKQNDGFSDHLHFLNKKHEVRDRRASILTYETDLMCSNHIDNINSDAFDVGNMEVPVSENAPTTRKYNCNLHFQPQQKQQLSQNPNSINSAYNNQSQASSKPSSCFIYPKQRIILNGKPIKNYIQQKNSGRNNNMNKSIRTQNNSIPTFHLQNNKTNETNQNNSTNNSNDEIKTVKVKATYCPEISHISDGIASATMVNETIVNGRDKNAFTQNHLKLSHAELKTAASFRTPTTVAINNRSTDLKIVAVSSLNTKLTSETIKNLPPIVKNAVKIVSNNLNKNRNKKTFDDIIISDDEL